MSGRISDIDLILRPAIWISARADYELRQSVDDAFTSVFTKLDLRAIRNSHSPLPRVQPISHWAGHDDTPLIPQPHSLSVYTRRYFAPSWQALT